MRGMVDIHRMWVVLVPFEVIDRHVGAAEFGLAKPSQELAMLKAQR